MRSKNSFSCGILFLFLICGFIANAWANTLFSIDSHGPAVVRAYAIEPNALGNTVTINPETLDPHVSNSGLISIAASNDLNLAFITYEHAYDVVVINSKTLEKVTQVQTLVYNPAGIVADDVKDKIYIIQRGFPYLYVYTWNDTTETLDFVNSNDLPDLSNGMGIALDPNHLYVTDGTATVRCYNTTTWAHESGYDITLPDGLGALGIAVYNDGAGGMGMMADAESMLISPTAPLASAAQQEAGSIPSEPTVEEQIEQLQQTIDLLYAVEDQAEDKDAWLGIVTSLEDMLKELQQD